MCLLLTMIFNTNNSIPSIADSSDDCRNKDADGT